MSPEGGTRVRIERDVSEWETHQLVGFSQVVQGQGLVTPPIFVIPAVIFVVSAVIFVVPAIILVVPAVILVVSAVILVVSTPIFVPVLDLSFGDVSGGDYRGGNMD